MDWLNDIMNISEEIEDSEGQENNEERQVQSEPIGRDTPSGYVGWGTFEDPTGAPIFPNATSPWMYEDPPKTWKEEVVYPVPSAPSSLQRYVRDPECID